MAASSEAARLLELFQLQSDQGPCLDCFRAGQPVAAADLAADAQRWPRFAAAARQAGFAAVQALPMRLRDQVIGALNLFRATPGAFDPADIRVGQALADVATISLLHERSMRHSDTLNEQLQTALNSRVIIEQAKGKLAERLGIDIDQAFSLLRDYARNRNRACPTSPAPSSTARKPSPARHRQATAPGAWQPDGNPPAPAGLTAQAVDPPRGAARRDQMVTSNAGHEQPPLVKKRAAREPGRDWYVWVTRPIHEDRSPGHSARGRGLL